MSSRHRSRASALCSSASAPSSICEVRPPAIALLVPVAFATSYRTCRPGLMSHAIVSPCAGCISLWRIAAKREQHSSIGDSVFALLIKVLRSDDPHVAAIGAASVWCLAQEEATLRRMPVTKLVRALLHTYPATLIDERQAEEAGGDEGAEGAEGGEGGEGGEAAVEAAEAEEPDEEEESEPDSPGRAEREQEAAEEFARHSEIVHQAIGKRLDDLKFLPIRALSALMRSEDGRRAFHRSYGSLRLLPLLCDDDDQISSAVSSLFSRATAASAAICGDTLFRGGSRLLVEMATGASADFHPYEKRCLAADLLHFCVSRLKLREHHPVDNAFLDSIPSLMAILRICTLPLFIPINQATKLSHPLFAASKTEEQLRNVFVRAAAP